MEQLETGESFMKDLPDFPSQNQKRQRLPLY
jgi:hypothetical protein